MRDAILHPFVAMSLLLEALLPLAFFCRRAGLNLKWCSWSVTWDYLHWTFISFFYGVQVLASEFRIPCEAQDFLVFCFRFKLGKRLLKGCVRFRGHFLRLQLVDFFIQYHSGDAN